MKRILLIQPLPKVLYQLNEREFSEFPSLGLAILATKLSEMNCEVRIIYPDSLRLIDQEIQFADLIIIGDFRYYAYFCNPLPLIRHLISYLVKKFTGQILIGGRHSREIKRNSLCHSEFFSQVQVYSNISQLIKASVGFTDFDKHLGTDELPSPTYASTNWLINNTLSGVKSRDNHLKMPGQLLTLKGCPYKCAYCEKAKTRFEFLREADLELQLSEFEENEISYAIIWDEVFGFHYRNRQKHHLDILRNSNLNFGANCRISQITEPFIKSIASTGLKEILFGLEIINVEKKLADTMLIDMGKTLSMKQYSERINLLNNHGIEAYGSLIIGFPSDTEEKIAERIRFSQQIGFKKIYIRPLVPFPGTMIYSELKNSGRIDSFSDWPFTEYESFPFGYPTVSTFLERNHLINLSKIG